MINFIEDDIKSLDEAKITVEKLRHELLCCEFVDQLTGMSEQNLLLALSHLEIAQRHLAIASIQQKRSK